MKGSRYGNTGVRQASSRRVIGGKVSSSSTVQKKKKMSQRQSSTDEQPVEQFVEEIELDGIEEEDGSSSLLTPTKAQAHPKTDVELQKMPSIDEDDEEDAEEKQEFLVAVGESVREESLVVALPEDTYSVLMVCRYPFLDFADVSKRAIQNVSSSLKARTESFGTRHKKEELKIPAGVVETLSDDNAEGDDKRNHQQQPQKQRKAWSYADVLYFPFWLGVFVILCQIFAYTIVITNTFQDEPPPNVDRTLRLAQVRGFV